MKVETYTGSRLVSPAPWMTSVPAGARVGEPDALGTAGVAAGIEGTGVGAGVPFARIRCRPARSRAATDPAPATPSPPSMARNERRLTLGGARWAMAEG